MVHTVYSKNETKKIYRKKNYYFLLTAVICLCILQLIGGSLYNLTRYIFLDRQINQLEKLNKSALVKNRQLKTQVTFYSSSSGIEELARNNLKMVGQDEVLVLIKEQPEETKDTKQKTKNLLKSRFKQ